MKIETEFDNGQKVWFMRDNKCDNLPIIEISCVVIGVHKPHIYYNFQTEDGVLTIIEKRVFATKEELISSLWQRDTQKKNL